MTTSFRRKPESSALRRWTPAFAGVTKNWIPAFTGMTLLLSPALAPAQVIQPDPELRKVLLEAVSASDSFEHRFDAEVWLADMSDRMVRYVPKAMPDTTERLAFLRLLHSEARRANVPPELVLSVIEIESRFDRFAVSRVGALGYMQVMPFWLKELNRPYDNLFKAGINLRMGCTILKFYLDREKGDLVKALARYNGSYGRPQYPYKVLEALTKRWFRE
jgi:soluble lytic murein transglycosylase-like protein